MNDTGDPTCDIQISQCDEGGWILQTRQAIACPIDDVFKFFSDATNLERLTPPFLKFKVLTPTPIEMHEGTLIDYRLTLRGFPLRWQSRITDWQPGIRFIDEQIRGPYRLWRHEHTFEKQNSNTIIGDRVHYNMFGGQLIHNLLVRKDLIKIFYYRQKILEQIFTTNHIASQNC